MKRVTALIMAVFMAATLAAGCQPARKPVPQTPSNRTAPRTTPAPAPTTPAPARKPAPTTGMMPTTSPELHKIATKLAKEASTVKGVKKATVAITNKTAYVGLDLAANIEASKTKTIKKDVANKVKKADKRLTNVYVTSDVAIVTRIKRVASGIGSGKPVSSFAKEFTEIGRRIEPQKSK